MPYDIEIEVMLTSLPFDFLYKYKIYSVHSDPLRVSIVSMLRYKVLDRRWTNTCYIFRLLYENDK